MTKLCVTGVVHLLIRGSATLSLIERRYDLKPFNCFYISGNENRSLKVAFKELKAATTTAITQIQVFEICSEEDIFCPVTSKCIDNKTPCGEKCLSGSHPKFERVTNNYEDKSICKSCDSNEWQCGFGCISKDVTCPLWFE